MGKPTLLKDLSATLDYAVDWTAAGLPASASIVSSIWAVDPVEIGGLTFSGAAHLARSSRVSIAGGVFGHIYLVSNRVLTSGGQELNFSALIRADNVIADFGSGSIGFSNIVLSGPTVTGLGAGGVADAVGVGAITFTAPTLVATGSGGSVPAAVGSGTISFAVPTLVATGSGSGSGAAVGTGTVTFVAPVVTSVGAAELLAGPPPANTIIFTQFGSSSYESNGSAPPDNFKIIDFVKAGFTSGQANLTELANSGANTSATHAQVVAATADQKAGGVIVATAGNLTTHEDNAATNLDLFRDMQDVVVGRPGSNSRFMHTTGINPGPVWGEGSTFHREFITKGLQRDGRLACAWTDFLRLVGRTQLRANWSTLLPTVSAGDLTTITETDTTPPALTTDNTHFNEVGKEMIAHVIDLPMARALNNGAPCPPFGFRLYSRAATNQTSGQIVGTLPTVGGLRSDGITPRTNKFQDCTVTLGDANSDFSVAVESNEIVIRRASNGTIAAGETLLWVRISKTGFTVRDWPVFVILESPAADTTAKLKEISPNLPDAAIATTDVRGGPWISRRPYNGNHIPAACRGFSLVMDLTFLGATAIGTAQMLFVVGGTASTAANLTIRVQKIASGAAELRIRDTAGTTLGSITTTQLYTAGTRRWLFASLNHDSDFQHIALDDTAAITGVPASDANILVAATDTVTLFSGGIIGSNGQSHRPCKVRTGLIWAHIGTGIDWTVAANRNLFRDAATKEPVLNSVTGIVSGLTPHVWMPPQFTSGDLWAGRNSGSLGEMVTIRRGAIA